MIVDEFGELPIIDRVERFRGAVVGMRTDSVQFGERIHDRDYVTHFGAVAIVALDIDDRVLVILQYRHPVAARLWEIPAGLLDIPGEDPLDAAKRELLEEAGVVATRWDVLLDYATTPGGSSELIRIYLARDLTLLGERPRTDEAEEQDMPALFVPIDELYEAVIAGAVCNTSIVAGTLAVRAARDSHWTTLRPAHAPWPLRSHLARHERVLRG